MWPMSARCRWMSRTTRPGLSHVTASCHGETGPSARRVVFDQVAGTVTGMVAAEGSLDEPELPPTSTIDDYLVTWVAADPDLHGRLSTCLTSHRLSRFRRVGRLRPWPGQERRATAHRRLRLRRSLR